LDHLGGKSSTETIFNWEGDIANGLEHGTLAAVLVSNDDELRDELAPDTRISEAVDGIKDFCVRV
jgi:hypothetical protein